MKRLKIDFKNKKKEQQKQFKERNDGPEEGEGEAERIEENLSSGETYCQPKKQVELESEGAYGSCTNVQRSGSRDNYEVSPKGLPKW